MCQQRRWHVQRYCGRGVWGGQRLSNVVGLTGAEGGMEGERDGVCASVCERERERGRDRGLARTEVWRNRTAQDAS